MVHVCLLSVSIVPDSLQPYGLYVACQVPLSTGFPRQEHWSRLLCPSPGDLPDPGMEPGFPVSAALQADYLPLSHWGSLKDDGRIIKIFSCI